MASYDNMARLYCKRHWFCSTDPNLHGKWAHGPCPIRQTQIVGLTAARQQSGAETTSLDPNDILIASLHGLQLFYPCSVPQLAIGIVAHGTYGAILQQQHCVQPTRTDRGDIIHDPHWSGP
eukprot:CAMPEP_0177538900 /NCGR_PEP_ID=MMETSP0369-20130122/58660_1 /TAXON_ID=447022 ORGANISM="Scrippsiella hangoei-like, Strain SHHI-4" /NCGR_SAMPLE_ID=MMETSP0369 /ASSEMBLY_ACC=CAM_ASM_000364 /LENGTH=120 /DNA_ID=CAMNT_0019021815 /DNA_START=36 /DNA_END=395 /DNA_ORIENTATION=-